MGSVQGKRVLAWTVGTLPFLRVPQSFDGKSELQVHGGMASPEKFPGLPERPSLPCGS